MSSRALLLPLILCAAETISLDAADAASTTAHAMIVSGHAGHVGGDIFACATSGPQPMSRQFFGSASVGLPTEGYAYCGLSGGIDDHSNPNGISTAHEALTNSGYSNGTHTQTADATADFGVLKASSTGSYSGNDIGGFAYHDGEAAAYSTDTLPTPTGAHFFRFSMTIDGSAAVPTNGQSIAELVYQVNSGPIYEMFIANVLGSSASARGMDGTSIVDLPGFTITPGGVSGADTVISFLTEITSGSTFDLTLGMLAASYPSPFGGSADVSFEHTARLSALDFYDANGNLIDYGSITGASGRVYDADGVHMATGPTGGVPEPASWAMMLLGFGAIGAAIRYRRRRTTAAFA